MYILTVLLQIALIIVSLLLIGVILLQKPKGGSGVSFGGMGESLFGAEVGNVLTRSTIILGCLFVLFTVVLSIIIART